MTIDTDSNNSTLPGTGNPVPDTAARDRRAETSPANGARSKGPKTESGKKRSSANSLKHGLYSRQIVLGSESQDEYDAHQAYYLETYAPSNPEEFDLVMDMVNSRWLLRRVERHEKALFQVELARVLPAAKDEFQDPDAEVAEALAWQSLAATKIFENLNRLAQRYERTYYRAKAALEGSTPGPRSASKPPKDPEHPFSRTVNSSPGLEHNAPVPANSGSLVRNKPTLNPRRWFANLWTLILAAVLFLAAAVSAPANRHTPTSTPIEARQHRHSLTRPISWPQFPWAHTTLTQNADQLAISHPVQ